MTLTTAMQIIRQILDGKELPSVADRNAAIALGYEAISRIKECRLADHMIREDLLPGETLQPPDNALATLLATIPR